uniref:SMP-LTD domain-containing protein n=1 Tax=Pygocentrus nattereri TaxID=42514 RepID=A0AAR2IMH2_PYGNA
MLLWYNDIKIASLRPKPLLSLVKSLSTEISRREPEVCLSRSDSKLHLQPWKHVTKPWDEAEAEPSGLLLAELEDTRRKFSEAMQEPFSVLSKIMGEEGGGSPKTQKGDSTAGGGSPARTEEGSLPTVCETPLRKPRKGLLSSYSPEFCRKLGSEGSRYEIRTYGDIMQVVEIKGHSDPELRNPRLKNVKTTSSGPGRWLVCVSLLAYGFFVLPLSSYLTGLFLGMACGFMMGLAVVLMLALRRPTSAQKKLAASPDDSLPTDSISRVQRDLGGWMNEMNSYDPETYHPSMCHSVYVTLEGCHLRLAYPRTNIPRRASTHEPADDTTFVRSRSFQLTNSKVFLLPEVLAKKRVWNKKYPVCIVLAEEEEHKEDEGTSEPADEDNGRAEKPPLVEKEVGQTTVLYLFGRTGREKEEWYQHFLLASKADIIDVLVPDTKRHLQRSGRVHASARSSRGSTDDLASMLGLRELAGSVREKILLDYSSYMAHFVMSESCSLTPSPSHSEPGSPTDTHRLSSDRGAEQGESRPAWINALIGRIFWDFLREKYWADQVAHKIQKKLTKIKLPYFMNELTLAELDMGTCMPQVLSTSKPSVDQRGLWLELEVVYTGSLQMTLETKMNLRKLGRESVSEAENLTESSGLVGSRPRLCIIADSDEESSSAGSSDEEDSVPCEPQGTLGEKSMPPGSDGHGSGSTSRKILRFVDKIAKSKYFQKATENEYIKKKIAEVSNTPLLLTVEVLELSGTLAVNIPPPPTDRIWYSFRLPPRLDLRVKPMLGEREVTFTHVTEWIERKLQCEFQKVFVMPNMDDLYLPLMSSGMDNSAISQPSSGESQEQQKCGGLE